MGACASGTASDCSKASSGHGALAGQQQLAHVRNIENTNRFAHGHVLIFNSRIFNRHFEVGEFNHFRAKLFVYLIEGS